MRRVDQRRDDDCLRACAAMVLGIGYEETPEIRAGAGSSEIFWLEWSAWAARRGVEMRFWYGDDEYPLPVQLRRWIAVVPSLNFPGRTHVVVMRRRRLYHDPSPRVRREDVALGEVLEGIAFLPVQSRDYGGMRGPVPMWWGGALDWRDVRRLNESIERLEALARRPRKPPTGRGRFARGTFRVKL